jgi:hypothetical protein
MSATDYKFEGKSWDCSFPVIICPDESRTCSSTSTGWGAFGPDSVEGNFKKFEYEPKPWEETDVDSESIRLLLSNVRLGY